MPLVGLLLTVLLAPQGVPPGNSAFHPDAALTPPGGPEIAVFRAVSPDVVSVRLSVPFYEEPADAGAGWLILLQAQDRMQALAARIGARAEVHRTPQALVYEVAGSLADLDFLGWIVREGLRPPEPSDFADARRRLQSESDRRLETPQGVLYDQVRELLIPGSGPLTGTAGTLDRMDPERLRTIWTRTHRRDAMRLVVAGRVPTELVLSSFAGLGLPSNSPLPELFPSQDPGGPRPAPQVNRHWVVNAYPLPQGSEAAALVAARWTAARLRSQGGDFEVGVEIWDTGAGRALVVSGAAFPRVRQAMEQTVGNLFRDAAESIGEEDARRLSQELRAEIAMAARTPWGLTELAGQAWDAGQGPEGLELLLTRLEAVSRADVTDLLQALESSTPLQAELRP